MTGAETAPERPTGTRLLLDGALVRHHLTERMRLVTTTARKDTDAGVMLAEEFFSDVPRRWEARLDNAYPTVLRDPATGRLRLYYTLFVVDASATQTPLAQRAQATYRPSASRVTALAVAESEDGVTWTKPELGFVEFDGDAANNLLLMHAHGTGVLLDLGDPDPARRYKLVTRLDGPDDGGGMAVAYSADGLRFTTPVPWVGPSPRADSHNAPFRDPATGRYAITTRVWKDGTRVCVLSTSDDFLHWSEPIEILRGTPPWDQVYSMPVFVHGGQFIGLASVYHEGDRSAADFDLVDCELATAHELDSWQRIDPGHALIERGPGTYPTGAFDAGCIYAACPIEIDGTPWVYYFGGNGRHTGFRETGLGRVFVDLDRLAGYRTSGDDEGRLVVGPFTLSFDDLELHVDIEPEGALSWRLVDAEGTLLPGLAEELHELEVGDGWRDLPLGSALAEHQGKPIYIDFRARRAQLFAVRTDCTHERFR